MSLSIKKLDVLNCGTFLQVRFVEDESPAPLKILKDQLYRHEWEAELPLPCFKEQLNEM